MRNESKVLLTYADRRYRYSQSLNTVSARKHCRFDVILNKGPSDLSSDFRRKNRKLLSYDKGRGYWVWKPYIVLDTLRSLKDGDYLFYCDSGANFINDATVWFDLLRRIDQDIIISCSSNVEKVYTTRDAFILMECDLPEFTDSYQRIASFFAMRNTRWVREFCNEWLAYSSDARIVVDRPHGALLASDYPEFIESKGDQSVLSLLSKQYGLEVFRDPSQWGNHAVEAYPNSAYPQFIDQTWLVPEPVRWKRLRNKIMDRIESIF